MSPRLHYRGSILCSLMSLKLAGLQAVFDRGGDRCHRAYPHPCTTWNWGFQIKTTSSALPSTAVTISVDARAKSSGDRVPSALRGRLASQ